MKNYLQPGATVTVPAPSTVTSGQFVQVGEMFGVAAGDVSSGQPLDLVTEGVFALPKASTAIFTVGAPVYWNGNAGDNDSTAGDLRIGTAVEAAGNGATSAKVRLSGHF